jgi:hypothetical protein
MSLSLCVGEALRVPCIARYGPGEVNYMIDEMKLLDMSDEALLEIVRTHSLTNETAQGSRRGCA